MKFSDIHLHPLLKANLDKINFVECTPIQEQAIPLLRKGKDLSGLAQTGTGKTGAFLIPLKMCIRDRSRTEFSVAVCPLNRILNRRHGRAAKHHGGRIHAACDLVDYIVNGVAVALDAAGVDVTAHENNPGDNRRVAVGAAHVGGNCVRATRPARFDVK